MALDGYEGPSALLQRALPRNLTQLASDLFDEAHDELGIGFLASLRDPVWIFSPEHIRLLFALSLSSGASASQAQPPLSTQALTLLRAMAETYAASSLLEVLPPFASSSRLPVARATSGSSDDEDEARGSWLLRCQNVWEHVMSTAPRAERRSAKAAPRKRRRTGASATDAAEQRESEGLTEEGAQILALLVLLWRAERRAASPDSLVLPKGAKGKKPETQLHLARQMRGPWPKTDVGEALDTLIAALKHGKVGADLCAELFALASIGQLDLDALVAGLASRMPMLTLPELELLLQSTRSPDSLHLARTLLQYLHAHSDIPAAGPSTSRYFAPASNVPTNGRSTRAVSASLLVERSEIHERALSALRDLVSATASVALLPQEDVAASLLSAETCARWEEAPRTLKKSVESGVRAWEERIDAAQADSQPPSSEAPIQQAGEQSAVGRPVRKKTAPILEPQERATGRKTSATTPAPKTPAAKAKSAKAPQTDAERLTSLLCGGMIAARLRWASVRYMIGEILQTAGGEAHECRAMMQDVDEEVAWIELAWKAWAEQTAADESAGIREEDRVEMDALRHTLTPQVEALRGRRDVLQLRLMLL